MSLGIHKKNPKSYLFKFKEKETIRHQKLCRIAIWEKFKWDKIQQTSPLDLTFPLLLEITVTSKEDVKQKTKDYKINTQIGLLIHEFKF